MDKTLTAVILDDQTVLLDGRELAGTDDVAETMTSILRNHPHLVLMIEATPGKHYEGIGKVIYGSARAGLDLKNLHYSWEDGRVS